MEQFVNQPVVNWAQQYSTQPIEVKINDRKVLIGICLGILALIFGGIALAAYASAISTLAGKGWTQEVTGSLVGGTFMLAFLIAMVGGLLLLGKLTRRNFARYLSGNGVQTRSGRQYNWADLYYLDYKKVRNTAVSVGGAGLVGHFAGRVAASAAQAAVYAGHEKVMVVMVFANGKAIVPPLVKNQQEVLGILSTMPVQRRFEGKVSQQ